MLSQVDLKCFKSSFISYTCMMLVIINKTIVIHAFELFDDDLQPSKKILYVFSLLHLAFEKSFLGVCECFSSFQSFLIMYQHEFFFRKLQKSHSSLGSSIITYQQLVTIFQACNYFSCHWLPFLFMHYKLPTSQNFNKINVKIAK